MSKAGKDIRSEFIKFFEQRGHAYVPSSSLLPGDDPTLLFANAGMNQFKAVFLGAETRDYSRAVNTQKCIRAGGKHNDLEDVGRDCCHHTFFEMLGNWSFGDYFKREAIEWAWELLTNVWALPKDRLWATVFGGDEKEGLGVDTEAEQLWRDVTDIDPTHIVHGDKKDNFWEMGQAGPCGPCSEIHIDLTDDGSGGALVNAGDPRVIEIWNLVFIQFNRDNSGKLSPLPAKHVDTGMGLERIGAVLNGKKSNYATDLWIPIIEKIEQLSGKQYGLASNPKSEDRYDAIDESNLVDVAMRVIADHARTLSFAIADGILPSNDGRGSVLRSILRRAAGFGRQHLGIEATFIHKLVPTIVELMGETFPELKDRRQVVIDTITEEEESFAKTLDRGLALFRRQVEKLQSAGLDKISGEDAFDLHATYGFPFTLTKLMAEKAGFEVDEKGYEKLMEEHRATSGAGGNEKFQVEQIVGLPATDDSARYDNAEVRAKMLGWVLDGKFVDKGELSEGAEAAVVLERTNFYGESGGQEGDCGALMGEAGVFDVDDTKIVGQCVLHVGRVRKGIIASGQAVSAVVCGPRRRDTMRNHSATHLLNWALRRVAGEGCDQAGSAVDGERLRFDFMHNQGIPAGQLAEIERLVNEKILADEPISAKLMPLVEAKKLPGARAVFGEKYPDPVRVVTMGVEDTSAGEGCSVEFCGGTHLRRTGLVGLFKIISEESVARGVRRITAVTGRGAVEWVRRADAVLSGATAALKVPPDQLVERIAAMQKEIKKLRKRPASGDGEELSDAVTLDTPAGKILVARSGPADPAAMRNLCDRQRQKGAAAVFLGAADEEDSKVVLIAMVSEELVKAVGLKAGDWVRHAAPLVGGSGGGRPTLAQAGGKQPQKLPEALAAAIDFAREKLA